MYSVCSTKDDDQKSFSFHLEEMVSLPITQVLYKLLNDIDTYTKIDIYNITY